MKKWLIMIVVATLITSCATTAEKMEREAKVAAQVKEALDNQHYTIRVHMMYPRRGSARNVSNDFSLEVKGDTLVSYLPYFGRAYNIPYGGGKGLNFTAPILSYERVRIKKNLTRVILMTENEEDQYLYELEIFDNGSSSIWVRSRQREDIHYSGEMN